ncbi:hypothetical protein [Mesorhizobium sp.]|uniref:hypothetical protein n=1 Tax=Mesorhizobium sp. TaxID=1871066 RepID=UPI0025DA7442|nr:hypothetical protein [Mesorhizobium sp.]
MLDGVDHIYPQTSALLKNGGRINLTLRRVMNATWLISRVHKAILTVCGYQGAPKAKGSS